MLSRLNKAVKPFFTSNHDTFAALGYDLIKFLTTAELTRLHTETGDSFVLFFLEKVKSPAGWTVLLVSCPFALMQIDASTAMPDKLLKKLFFMIVNLEVNAFCFIRQPNLFPYGKYGTIGYPA